MATKFAFFLTKIKKLIENKIQTEKYVKTEKNLEYFFTCGSLIIFFPNGTDFVARTEVSLTCLL